MAPIPAEITDGDLATYFERLVGFSIFFTILFGIIAAMRAVAKSNADEKQRDAQEQITQQAEARRLIHQAQYEEITPHVPPGVLSKPGEVFYWSEPAQRWAHQYPHYIPRGLARRILARRQRRLGSTK